jgi:molybdate transport system permease protein
MRRFSLALTGIVFLAISVTLLSLVTYSSLPALAASLSNPEIQFAIMLSLVTSAISTLICIAVAIPVAYALSRYRFFGKKVVELVLTTPLTLPPLVAGIALLLFFGTTPWGKAMDNAGFEVILTT